MFRYRQILSPIDFSRTSVAALDQAIRIARNDGAAVHAIHIVEDSSLPFPEGSLLLSEGDRNQVRKQLEAQLRDLTASHRDRLVALESHLSLGAPAKVILNEAREIGCDLIVMGTTGKTGLSQLLLGTTLERVVRNSPVDVLAVPTVGADAPSGSFETVVCAVDFSDASEFAFVRALDFASKHGARVHVVHAWELSAYAPALSELTVAYERTLQTRLDEMIGRHPAPDVSVRAHVRRGIVHQEIVRCATELAADVLVVGALGHGGLERFLLGSVAERVVRTSRVPVLVVRR